MLHFGGFPLTLVPRLLHQIHMARSILVLAGDLSVEKFDCKFLFCHLSALSLLRITFPHESLDFSTVKGLECGSLLGNY